MYDERSFCQIFKRIFFSKKRAKRNNRPISEKARWSHELRTKREIELLRSGTSPARPLKWRFQINSTRLDS